ncbi:MAG: binding-protein-dependent transport system inner rane component [Xanthobacteraceae bacterium]|jgi:putative spermidine/putrescine transport system permease protein|nr:binding-protein-dependent transport system inner rane component [Xanthobacteraceae bacterium]
METMTADEARAEARTLRASLRRAERRRTLRGLGLALPLILFTLVFFVLPIAGMLVKAVQNGPMPDILPQTSALLQQWRASEERAVPDEAVFAAFAGELRAASQNRTLPELATRLNFENAGYRSLLMSTARRLPEAPAGTWRDTFTGLNPQWGEVSIWAALGRASPRLTDGYVLAALDHRRDDNDHIQPTDPSRAVYVASLTRTLEISATVTLLCLVLAYPLAYRLATLPESTANLLMILVLLPFWTSLLVRTASWLVILQREGPLNEALQWLGLIDQPLQLVFNRPGVVIAMTHVLLPFMVLPIYSVMRGIPPNYMRAATSLGAPFLTAFRRVYFPLSLPGVTAGCLLVFILAIGYYITPLLIGGANDQMVSALIAFLTLQTLNWGLAAALGTVLLVITIALYFVYTRVVGTDGMKLG